MKEYLIDKNDIFIYIGEYFSHTSGPKGITHRGQLLKSNNELIILWDDDKVSKYCDFVTMDNPEWCKALIEKCIT